MAKIPIRVYGEFITEVARTWFWDELKPYHVSEQLILDCIVDAKPDEAKQIAQDIIEGRKKLIGCNAFELVDDNENIRYITDRIDKIKTESFDDNFDDIMNELDTYAVSYLDPYVICAHNSSYNFEFDAFHKSYDSIWFNRRANHADDDEYAIDGPAKLGLWLHDYPGIVSKAIRMAGGSPRERGGHYRKAFWDAIYEIIKDDERFTDDEFKMRNECYLIKRKNELEKEKRRKELAEKAFTLQDYQKSEIKQAQILIKKAKDVLATITDDNEINRIRKDELEMIINSFDEDIKHLTSGQISNIHELHTYDIYPDDYENWEGLIAPNGDFYSCEFGGHNAKAYILMKVWLNKFQKIKPTDFSSDKRINMSNALDTLIEQGWCVTRTYDYGGAYLNIPANKRITKAQENAIFDVINKHQIEIDLSDIGY